VSDRFTFLLPGAVLLSILGIRVLGAQSPRPLSWRPVLIALAPAALLHALALVHLMGLLPRPQHRPAELPFMDEASYFIAPLVPESSALRFAQAYERVVPVGAVVYADWGALMALRSAQVVGVFSGRDTRLCEDPSAAWPSRSGRYLVRGFGCEAMLALPHEAVRIGMWIPGQDGLLLKASTVPR
jgi:hypothetical protein